METRLIFLIELGFPWNKIEWLYKEESSLFGFDRGERKPLRLNRTNFPCGRAEGPLDDGENQNTEKMSDPIERKEEDTSRNETKESPSSRPLSKTAQKKLLKLQRFEEKKVVRKAFAKEKKQKENERKRKEWEEKLETVTEEEKLQLIEAKRDLRKERMEKRLSERQQKIDRLNKAKIIGQSIVIDLEFSDLMTSNEINSLVQQIMYCYSGNGKCTSPSHLWLTGCEGEMNAQLNRIPGFDKWIIEKEAQSYIDALKDQKDNLVYLTADSENILDELNPSKIYIIGGLVDRNRWKGLTMKKATDQGIQTAKLPIGDYLKLSSSQVLTVNQVFEILLKFLETKDWKTSFFQVIPSRKRSNIADEEGGDIKRYCTEEPANDFL